MLFFSVLFLVLVICTSAVSAEPGVPERSESSAVSGVGEDITIGGETNLAIGTVILITVEEAAFRPSEKGGAGAFSGTSGTVVVQEGTPPSWSFSFATTGWTPGEYLITMEVPKTGAMDSDTFTLLPAGDIPETSPPLSPQSPSMGTPAPFIPSPVPPPTTVSLSLAVGVAGFAAVYLFRVRCS